MPFNRILQVKLVKPSQAATDSAPTDYKAVTKDLIKVAAKQLVVGAVVVIATTVVLNAASQIAVTKLTTPNN